MQNKFTAVLNKMVGGGLAMSKNCRARTHKAKLSMKRAKI